MSQPSLDPSAAPFPTPPYQEAPQAHQQQETRPAEVNHTAKLFVGQLPFECDEQRLGELFGAYGNVLQIHILKNPNNTSRGAAFVLYSCTQEADIAIFTLHNRYRMLSNRAIQVSYAKNSPNISRFGEEAAREVHRCNNSNPLPLASSSTDAF